MTVYKNCTVRVASQGLVDSPLMTAECAALVTAGGEYPDNRAI